MKCKLIRLKIQHESVLEAEVMADIRRCEKGEEKKGMGEQQRSGVPRRISDLSLSKIVTSRS